MPGALAAVLPCWPDARSGADKTSLSIRRRAAEQRLVFLHGRQARYYAPAMLCTAAVVYFYVF